MMGWVFLFWDTFIELRKFKICATIYLTDVYKRIIISSLMVNNPLRSKFKLYDNFNCLTQYKTKFVFNYSTRVIKNICLIKHSLKCKLPKTTESTH